MIFGRVYSAALRGCIGQKSTCATTRTENSNNCIGHAFTMFTLDKRTILFLHAMILFEQRRLSLNLFGYFVEKMSEYQTGLKHISIVELISA